MADSPRSRGYPASTVALLGACLAGAGLLGGMALDRMMTGNVTPLTVPETSSAAGPTHQDGIAGRPAQAGPGLSVSRDMLRQALDSPVEPRFRYEESQLADGLTRCTGRLSGDRVFVELDGPEENLTRACLTLQLVPKRDPIPKGTEIAPPPTYEVPESLYMLLLANALASEWKDCGRWIEGALADAAGGVPASVSRGGVRFTLSRLDKFGVLLFSAEPE